MKTLKFKFDLDCKSAAREIVRKLNNIFLK